MFRKGYAMEKNKKEKIIIIILLLILAILLLRLLLLRKGNDLIDSQDTGTSHMYSDNSTQLLTQLENEGVLHNDLYKVENYSEKGSSKTEISELEDSKAKIDMEQGTVNNKSFDDKNLDKEKVVSQDKHFAYMDMFPDMYVETVKPVIQLKEKKIAYLSFDDGPSRITKDILKILEEEEIQATFFVIGSTLTEEGEECLKMMVEQGHEIGIHTYSHNYKKIYASVEDYLEDFYTVYEQVYEITGVQPRIFRFPWGSINSYNKSIKNQLITEMERRGFTYYDWNVSAEDSIGKPTEYKVWKNVMKDIEKYKYPIILMHDSSTNRVTANSLEKVIKSIREKGYDFDTLNHREPYQFGKTEK